MPGEKLEGFRAVAPLARQLLDKGQRMPDHYQPPIEQMIYQ